MIEKNYHINHCTLHENSSLFLALLSADSHTDVCNYCCTICLQIGPHVHGLSAGRLWLSALKVILYVLFNNCSLPHITQNYGESAANVLWIETIFMMVFMWFVNLQKWLDSRLQTVLTSAWRRCQLCHWLEANRSADILRALSQRRRLSTLCFSHHQHISTMKWESETCEYLLQKCDRETANIFNCSTNQTMNKEWINERTKQSRLYFRALKNWQVSSSLRSLPHVTRN